LSHGSQALAAQEVATLDRYAEPVRLVGFSGEADSIRKLAFAFSNRRYAASFTKLNRTLIGKGLLRV
jgi:hypothetical protein